MCCFLDMIGTIMCVGAIIYNLYINPIKGHEYEA